MFISAKGDSTRVPGIVGSTLVIVERWDRRLYDEIELVTRRAKLDNDGTMEESPQMK